MPNGHITDIRADRLTRLARVAGQKHTGLKLLLLSCQWRVLLVYRGPTHSHTTTPIKAGGWRQASLRLARRCGLKAFIFTDGLLHPLQPNRNAPLLSITAMELGQAPCLEGLIQTPYTAEQQERGGKLVGLWRRHRLSGYNHNRDYQGALPPRYVLVIDEGDADILEHMLASALCEFPDCLRVVLPCPDQALAGLSKTAAPPLSPKLALPATVHPATLLEQAQAVYCHTSNIGFEGLLWGKRVHTFGRPFYYGWGLTHDRLPPPAPRPRVPLENLVYAVLVAHTAYLDPETLQLCEPERLLAWLGWQRAMSARFPEKLYAHGFSNYKKPIVRRFFQGSQVLFDCLGDSIPPMATLVLWGRRAPPADLANRLCLRLEDGFVRSVGLGADLIWPLSWAIDTRGIYYDATQPSDLEHILQHQGFDPDLLARARHLRERLVSTGLTKYNVGTVFWQRPNTLSVKVILVPGQVESDASLAYGAPVLHTNLALLKAVRTDEPNAYILYKPHPDVLAGLRQQGQGEAEARSWCNEVITDAAMGDLLGQIDEVHTLTSLTGFEALLRGKKVVCYGLPFYAGWGLTNDKLTVARRTRRLSLDELVAATLILYPTYISRSSGRFTTPERALDELLLWRESSRALPWWRKLMRHFLKAEILLKTYLNNTL